LLFFYYYICFYNSLILSLVSFIFFLPFHLFSVVADPALVGLPDEEILAQAAQSRRTLVTANIKDFMPLALINLLAAAGQVAPDHVVFLTRS
jgi:hypothetical protein